MLLAWFTLAKNRRAGRPIYWAGHRSDQRTARAPAPAGSRAAACRVHDDCL